MIPLRVGEIADLLDADRAGVDRVLDEFVTGVTTDSRETVEGDLYVARIGEHADGADFAADAVGAGATVVVAQRRIVGVPTLVVDDADVALTTIARALRDRAGAAVVAVTGSVGKTTTKDLVAAALGPSRVVVAARGSLNNEVGVPLTVARLEAATEVLVTELGARGPGHVAELAAWLRPDVAIVTSVAEVHLEMFGSIEAIARAKAELVEAVDGDGVAVLNVDDPRVAAMASRTPARVVTVSAAGDPGADLRAGDVALDELGRARFVAATPWGDHDVALPIAGRHHVGNALLALAAVGVLGADVAAGAKGLSDAGVSSGRSRILRVAGATVLDDSYNANPTSVVSALETIRAMDATARKAVLGVMGEIGPGHDHEHRRVGAHAATVLDALVVVGADAVGIAEGAREAGLADVVEVDRDDAADAVAMASGDVVLVKASRVAGLEAVVADLTGQEAP